MGSEPEGVAIRPFAPADQAAARGLILTGLGEHFGIIEEKTNGDLDDIASMYGGEGFFVAELLGEVVGTGALIYEGDRIGRIVRMSVRKAHRRRGIATTILCRLLERARALGCRQVVLETGFWQDSIGFYKSRGFRETSRDAYGPNMARDL